MYRIACHEDNFVKETERTKDKLYASSTLKENNNVYKVQNLFDKRTETCWNPGGDGITEFVSFFVPRAGAVVKGGDTALLSHSECSVVHLYFKK
jgi:hypothetical protein